MLVVKSLLFECLIDLLSKIGQVFRADGPDNFLFMISQRKGLPKIPTGQRCFRLTEKGLPKPVADNRGGKKAMQTRPFIYRLAVIECCCSGIFESK